MRVTSGLAEATLKEPAHLKLRHAATDHLQRLGERLHRNSASFSDEGHLFGVFLDAEPLDHV